MSNQSPAEDKIIIEDNLDPIPREELAPFSEDDLAWLALTKGKSIITDLGVVINPRYAAWVYKDGKHHIAYVGNDLVDLKRRFKVPDELVFRIGDPNAKIRQSNYRVGNRNDNSKNSDNKIKSKNRTR